MNENITKLKFGILIILAMGCLSGCCLRHEWQEATCTSPRTCEKCGETEGEALGHEWQEATCTSPRICEKCGKTEGEALGHEWQEATCTTAETCKICGDTKGSLLGHEWQEATCTAPRTCVNCGETEGEILGHELNSGGFCLFCGTQFGDEITENNYEHYFEVTWSDQTVSPYTITVKPKFPGYTYGGVKAPGDIYLNPYITINISGLKTTTSPNRNYDVVFEDTIVINLDESGYGSATYNWSGTGAIRVSIPRISSVYAYRGPKQYK